VSTAGRSGLRAKALAGSASSYMMGIIFKDNHYAHHE
jgi:hypothetical protein